MRRASARCGGGWGAQDRGLLIAGKAVGNPEKIIDDRGGRESEPQPSRRHGQHGRRRRARPVPPLTPRLPVPPLSPRAAVPPLPARTPRLPVGRWHLYRLGRRCRLGGVRFSGWALPIRRGGRRRRRIRKKSMAGTITSGCRRAHCISQMLLTFHRMLLCPAACRFDSR